MKIVLMVAAGIAVGVTVALAVLVQVLAALLQVFERLAPLLVAAALVVLVLRIVGRRRGGRGDHGDHVFPLPAVPPSAPLKVAHSAPSVADQERAPYLRWGPPVQEDLDAPHVAYGVRHHASRLHGAHPSGSARGRRR